MNAQKLIEMARSHQTEQAESLVHLSGLDLDGVDHVVTCGGLALTFDVSAVRRVSNPRVVPPHRAMRFTKQQAEAIAKTVGNGNHTIGTAVPVLDAIRADMAERARTLAYLEALAAAAQDESQPLAA